jgi:hypothetical protein
MSTTTTAAPTNTDAAPAPVASVSLATYMEAMRTAGIPVLGFQVWYQVFEGEVTHLQLGQWFRELGLPLGRMPSPPRDSDAFEAATGDTKMKYPIDGREIQADGRAGRRKVGEKRAEAELTVVHVARDDSRRARWIERHVVRKVTDERDVKLSYRTKLATALFQYDKAKEADPGAGAMAIRLEHGNIADLEEYERAKVAAFIEEVKASYDHRRRYLSSKKLREMLQKIVDGTKAVQLKPGLYFVTAEHAELMEKLHELTRKFGNGSQFNSTPLVAIDQHREMVITAFTQQARDEVEKLTTEMAKYLALAKSGKKPGAAQISELAAKLKKAKERAAEHSALLNVTLGDTDTLLDAANRQFNSLMKQL